MRANDPIYEVGLAMGGHKQEDKFWRHTLHGVATYFSADGPVTLQMVCVDRRRQWSNARNIWKNAAVRTALNTPARWFRRGRKLGQSLQRNPSDRPLYRGSWIAHVFSIVRV